MNHSPGPWTRAGVKDNVSRSAVIRDATGFEVANTNSWITDTWEANANLVAAAPELLASIEKIEHFATGDCDMPTDIRLRCIARTCQAVRAAMRSETNGAKDA